MTTRKPFVFVAAAVLIGIFAFAYLIATRNGDPDDDVKTSQLEIGRQALKDGNIDTALDVLSKELNKRPEDPMVHALVGQAHLAQGNIDSAIEAFSTALTYDSLYTPAYEYRALAYFQNGEIELSLSDCNQALELDSDLVEVYFLRGDINRITGNPTKAISDYSEVLTRDSERIDAYEHRGDLYFAQREYDLAIEDFSSVINSTNAPTAYAKRAQVHLAQQQYDQAFEDSNTAIELDATNGDAYSIRGRVYLHDANFDLAIVEFNQAINLVPNSQLAYFYRGEAYAALGYHNAAQADFTMVIEINPEYTRAYLARGEIYQAMGDYEAALDDFNHAVQTDINLDSGFIKRGLLYSELDKLPLALDDFSTAIRINPSSAQAYLYRARIQQRLDDIEAALDDYTTALKINGMLTEAYLERANIYYSQENYDNALVDYAKVIDLAPDTAIAYRRRSLIYAFQGDYSLTRTDRRAAAKYNQQTVNISIGDYDLEIRRILGVAEADGDTSKNGTFLVLEITLYNYGEKLCVSQNDFKARYEGQEATPTKMWQVKQSYYPDVEYPPQDGSTCLPQSRLWETFLVYDVPQDLTDITINFTPTDELRTEFALWLSHDTNTAEYNFALAEQDGVAITHIGSITIVEDIETVLDAERIEIENCNGQAERISTRAIGREIERSTTLDTRQYINAGIQVPLPPSQYLQGALEVEYERRFIQTEGETLSYYTEETMVAPPMSIAIYEITWMKVSKKGEIEIISEGETIILPFTIDHAIRADVRSLPSQSCGQ